MPQNSVRSLTYWIMILQRALDRLEAELAAAEAAGAGPADSEPETAAEAAGPAVTAAAPWLHRIGSFGGRFEGSDSDEYLDSLLEGVRQVTYYQCYGFAGQGKHNRGFTVWDGLEIAGGVGLSKLATTAGVKALEEAFKKARGKKWKAPETLGPGWMNWLVRFGICQWYEASRLLALRGYTIKCFSDAAL